MKNLVLKFGLIGGGIICFFLFATGLFWEQIMDLNLGEILGYASMLIALSAVFFGIKSYRDNQLNGAIKFGKGFQVGILITLVASLIYVLGWMAYTSVFMPDFMEKYIAHATEKMHASGESQATIDAKIAEMNSFAEMYKNPFVKAGITFLEIFPVGLLVTLVSAAILRKKAIEQTI